MASTFSTLKIELIGDGEQSGTWGNTTNNNWGSSSAGSRGLEQAIVGMATLVTGDFSANAYTMPYADSNAAQDFRAFVLDVTATLSGTGTVTVPAIEKPYLVFNNSVGGFDVTVKVAGQTGVTVPNGRRVLVYNNGTDVGDTINFLSSLQLGGNLKMPSASSVIDANNNELIKFPSTVASAVNEVTITNAATGSGPAIQATGNDTNIDLNFTPKGTGNIIFTANNVRVASAASILDSNNNELIKFPSAVGSAINEVTITNAATGSGPAVQASGGDTNIDLNFTPKGSGSVVVSTGSLALTTGNLRLSSGASVVDANSNELIKFPATVASAVNEVTISNAATGSNPSIAATGSDTNISLSFAAKGTGAYNFAGTADTAAEIRWFEDSDNGSNYVSFKAPATIATNVAWTLPAADGTTGQVLSTDGSGTLSWSTSSGGITTGKSIAMAMIFGF